MEQLFLYFLQSYFGLLYFDVFPTRDVLYLNDWDLSFSILALLARTVSE